MPTPDEIAMGETLVATLSSDRITAVVWRLARQEPALLARLIREEHQQDARRRDRTTENDVTNANLDQVEKVGLAKHGNQTKRPRVGESGRRDPTKATANLVGEVDRRPLLTPISASPVPDADRAGQSSMCAINLADDDSDIDDEEAEEVEADEGADEEAEEQTAWTGGRSLDQGGGVYEDKQSKKRQENRTKLYAEFSDLIRERADRLEAYEREYLAAGGTPHITSFWTWVEPQEVAKVSSRLAHSRKT
jgi:hypothetical protein